MRHFYTLIAILFLFPTLLFADLETLDEISFTTDNGIIKGDSLKGQLVYVDFWASWCKPCLKSFPWMNKMQEQHKDKGFKIIAVNVDKDRSLIGKFLDKAPADFTIAYDEDAELAEIFYVKGMPTSYIFDRNGKLVATHLGFREKKIPEYEAEIQSLLEAP